MDSIGFFLDLVSDEDVSLRVLRRTIRNTADNFMQLPDYEFKKNFRLNKEAFDYVVGELSNDIAPTVRSTSIPFEYKPAACLRFLAEGSYQRGIANDFKISISQPTFSQHLAYVLDLLEAKLCPKWITLDMSEEEKQAAKRYFYEKSAIPGVIMCVDGTHIKVIRPAENSSPHLFYNRKGYYSLNAMIICDHKQRIRYVNARHPGASHDSFIWNSSDAARYFENSFRNGERNTRLLGDAGYPLQPWLLTPCRSPTEGSRESRFNKSHSKARCEVEKTIGVLKNRFRCLLGARQLHYSPEKAVQITNVCCALHNICKHFNVHDELLEPSEEPTERDDFSITDDLSSTNSYRAEAINIRNEIVRAF